MACLLGLERRKLLCEFEDVASTVEMTDWSVLVGRGVGGGAFLSLSHLLLPTQNRQLSACPFRLCQRRGRILHTWLQMSVGSEEQADVQRAQEELDQV